MDSRIVNRCDQLFQLKMKFDGESYIGFMDINNDFNVHHTEIQFDSDDDWANKINRLKEELDLRTQIK